MNITKKILTIFFITLSISNLSYATGVFVGDDYFDHSHKKENSIISNDESELEKNTKNDFGTNAGYRIDSENLFGSAEVFYGSTQMSTRNFVMKDNKSNNVEVENRYGAKVNAAFSGIEGVTPFVSVGVANVKRSDNISDKNPSEYELTPLYGAGIKIELPLKDPPKKSKN